MRRRCARVGVPGPAARACPPSCAAVPAAPRRPRVSPPAPPAPPLRRDRPPGVLTVSARVGEGAGGEPWLARGLGRCWLLPSACFSAHVYLQARLSRLLVWCAAYARSVCSSMGHGQSRQSLGSRRRHGSCANRQQRHHLPQLQPGWQVRRALLRARLASLLFSFFVYFSS